MDNMGINKFLILSLTALFLISIVYFVVNHQDASVVIDKNP